MGRRRWYKAQKGGLDQCGVCNRIIPKTGWRSDFLIIVNSMEHSVYRWNWVRGDRQSVVPLASLSDAFSVAGSTLLVYLAEYSVQSHQHVYTPSSALQVFHTRCSVPIEGTLRSPSAAKEEQPSCTKVCIAYCRSFMCWINHGSKSDKMAHNHTMWYQRWFNQHVGNSGTHNPCPSCCICL